MHNLPTSVMCNVMSKTRCWARFAEPVDSSQVLNELFRDVAALTGGGVAWAERDLDGRGAVGFRPEMTVLPEGASLSSFGDYFGRSSLRPDHARAVLLADWRRDHFQLRYR